MLLDANTLATGHEFFALGAYAVSPDGRRLAYSIDTSGDERFTLKIKDLVTGELLADEIPDTAYGTAWAGNEHLFYTRPDEAWRPYVVLRHRLGSDPADDASVFTEVDERFWVGVDNSRDDAWVVITSGSRLTSECWLLDARRPEAEPRLVAPRRQGVEYEIEPAGDRLLILHNAGAEDFELAEAPLTSSSPAEWTPVLAAPARHPAARRQRVRLARRRVVAPRRSDRAARHSPVHRRQPGPGADIAFDEPLFTVDSPGGPDYDTAAIRVSYGSLLTPASVYDYRLDTGELILLKRTPVLDDPVHGPYVPERYVQERTWATADDGTEIPISVVRRADVPLDGVAPALLYGYGSYEISMDPMFAVSRLSLLDRGIVYAIAHVRGGGELGRRWYEDGKTTTKKNTFTDFVACAQHLVAANYTSTERLAARGGSAGGLLMGAVANLAPEQFRAIHASVPFVDALTTILDPDLPLTVIEWEEWGDPLHDPEIYAYMKSYSPYENVRADELPRHPRDHQPQRHPRLLRRTRQVGGRPAAGGRQRTAIGPSCSRRRCRPDTAGSAAGTRAGGKRPSNTRGSSTRSRGTTSNAAKRDRGADQLASFEQPADDGGLTAGRLPRRIGSVPSLQFRLDGVHALLP